mgnify:CR=1 FL=1
MKKFLIPLLCTAILLLCGGCDLSDKVRIGTAEITTCSAVN